LAKQLDSEPEEAGDALIFHVPGDATRPLDGRKLLHIFTAAREVAGRPDLTLHDLRHTALTNYTVAGASAKTVQVIGGHTTGEVAQRYQHLVFGAREEATDALNRHLGLVA
jgi:integrase